MKHELILTKDGSHTISIPEMKVTYHSVHGAIQESQHVFIKAGLIDSGLFDFIGLHHVLEMGFGTGLNALLTLIEAGKHKNRIYYTAIELYPLNDTEISQLNYCQQLELPDYNPLFEKIHACGWEEMYEITDNFRLTKRKCNLLDFSTENMFDIIYFDAFAPAAQPELWTKEIFDKMFGLLKPGGTLVTYCSKGEVRRNMIAAGFKVEKIPGPPGKREMLRAIRPQPTF
ncbi:MAG TPA: tRNA (5-methylaminomethyl-2-thiouridine)(34)-methyltransferase MnmD [Chitinophagaceae bacterium]|nr:tRNA (5-methylaminomethyl-2-thiouridine)(34)-methyltransferase MnmD [Chitinophagaceae bacterium]